jgi:hypothetical protein
MDIFRTIVTTTASVVTWELLKKRDENNKEESEYRNIKIKRDLMDEFSATCDKAGVEMDFQLKKMITDFNREVQDQER